MQDGACQFSGDAFPVQTKEVIITVEAFMG